jgi:hypothetical protein
MTVTTAGTDVFLANQGNVRRLDHSVRRFNRADKSLGFGSIRVPAFPYFFSLLLCTD